MSITYTPYASFGYLILKNEIETGHSLNDEIFKDGHVEIVIPEPNDIGRYGQCSGFSWLYTKGSIRWTNVYTGEQFVRSAGWSNIDSPAPVGLFHNEILEPTTVFCLGPTLNIDKIPKVPRTEVFRLTKDNQQTIPNNSKLFLAEGTLIINGTNYSGTRQLNVKTGDVVATASTDCYGLFFL